MDVKYVDMINDYVFDNPVLSNTEASEYGIKELPVSFGSHGIELQGTLILPPHATVSTPVPGAVLCHGFGSDRRVMESSAWLLVRKGIAAIIFDLRGHGLSGGCLDGNFYEDVVDAWGVLSNLSEVDSSRIALIGHSLGAFSSVLAANKIKKPKALIALSCPSDMSGTIFTNPSCRISAFIRRLATIVGAYIVRFNRMKVRVDWNKFTESWLKIKLSSVLAELNECTKLFVFSAGDLLTPYHRFATVYERTPGPKQKMLAQGSHVTPIEAEILRFEWIGWAVSALNSK